MPDPRRWRVLAVLMVVLFMALIDVGIVNVAIPSIQKGLGATDSQMQWVLAGYALTFGIGLVTAGRAGDVYGRGLLFIVGVVVFTLSSVWCGVAPNATMLNIARAFQGLGSCLISPQVVGMIQEYFRGPERGKAFGIFGSAVGASFVVGPTLGGYIIKVMGVENGWRWTFFINIPVGILAVFLAFLWFPRPLWKRGESLASGQSRSLDPVGAILLGLAVFTFLLPFVEGRGDALIWGFIPLSLVLFGAWGLWENREKRLGREPMVDLGIFGVRSFFNGTLMISLFFAGVQGIYVLVALYLQNGLGHSAFASGSIGIPGAIGSSLAALWGGRLVSTKGRQVVMQGMGFALAGITTSMVVVWLRSMGIGSEWLLWGTLGLLGIGQGLVISPNQALTLAEVPLNYAGSSGGIMQTGQRIGTSVGIAVLTAIGFGIFSLTESWSYSFIAGLGGALVITSVAAVVSWIDWRSRKVTRAD